MKYFKTLSLIFLLGIVLFNGCKDPCKDETCKAGDCVTGVCFCDAGYEGENCETKSATKFLGTYSFVEYCDNPDTTNLTIVVTEGQEVLGRVVFDNLFGYGVNVEGVVFDIYSIDIPEQNFENSTISGNAAINKEGTEIEIDYTVKFPNNSTISCTGTLTRNP